MKFIALFIAGALAQCSGRGPAAPPETILNNVRTRMLNVTGNPSGVIYATDDIAFVSEGKTLGVLNTTEFSITHELPMPEGFTHGFGITLTKHHKRVVVAADQGAVVFDVENAINGKAVTKTLNGTTSTQNPGNGSFEVLTSHNFAFISQEYGSGNNTPGNIDVIGLDGKPVGFVNLGFEVTGSAFSPDRSLLYVTSESTSPNSTTPGTLSVLDVETLIKNPSKALKTTVPTACGSVRVIVSQNGTIWVTARESNRLLAFDPKSLKVIAQVEVGTSPVGLTFAKNETRILTADSNRFQLSNATTGLSVVDVQKALAGQDAVLGQIPTGQFPREFATSPDGSTILVSDFGTKQIQSIDVSTLP